MVKDAKGSDRSNEDDPADYDGMRNRPHWADSVSELLDSLDRVSDGVGELVNALGRSARDDVVEKKMGYQPTLEELILHSDVSHSALVLLDARSLARLSVPSPSPFGPRNTLSATGANEQRPPPPSPLSLAHRPAQN